MVMCFTLMQGPELNLFVRQNQPFKRLFCIFRLKIDTSRNDRWVDQRAIYQSGVETIEVVYHRVSYNVAVTLYEIP